MSTTDSELMKIYLRLSKIIFALNELKDTFNKCGLIENGFMVEQTHSIRKILTETLDGCYTLSALLYNLIESEFESGCNQQSHVYDINRMNGDADGNK